jgi:hypothetical protein
VLAGEIAGVAVVDDVPSADGRDDKKASHFPSALQRGEVADWGLVVNCHGARLPSRVAIQIEEFLRFWPRSTFVTT